MRKAPFLVAMVALVAMAAVAVAAELKSGVQVGKFIDPFDVVKCSGGVDDDVSVGDKLCYRCKYGEKPMVIVFARKNDEMLVSLVEKLDAAVEKNADSKLRAFVNLIGESQDELEAEAKKLGKEHKADHVPIVVPVEFSNGPGDYGINPEAEVTVIMAEGGKVKANHAFAAGDLNKDGIKSILDDITKLIDE